MNDEEKQFMSRVCDAVFENVIFYYLWDNYEGRMRLKIKKALSGQVDKEWFSRKVSEYCDDTPDWDVEDLLIAQRCYHKLCNDPRYEVMTNLSSLHEWFINYILDDDKFYPNYCFSLIPNDYGICQLEIDDIEKIIDDDRGYVLGIGEQVDVLNTGVIEQGIIALQTIARGRNLRWRVPLHALLAE